MTKNIGELKKFISQKEFKNSDTFECGKGGSIAVIRDDTIIGGFVIDNSPDVKKGSEK